MHDTEPKARDITNEVLLAAFDRLPEDERARVDEQAEYLIRAMKQRSDRVFFGRLQALELLAKFGIWSANKRLRI